MKKDTDKMRRLKYTFFFLSGYEFVVTEIPPFDVLNMVYYSPYFLQQNERSGIEKECICVI